MQIFIMRKLKMEKEMYIKSCDLEARRIGEEEGCDEEQL